MKGLYLYCVRKSPLRRPAEEAGKSPVRLWRIKAVRTIDKGEAYTIPHQELEAVVSEVNLKEFGSEEIQRKAQEDINWIKEKAQIHEHVIERAMAVGGKIMPVIPMKFGTIFKTKKNLKEVLEKNYSKFRKLLENLEGKQEWGVKVYLNEEVFEKTIKKRAKEHLGASRCRDCPKLPASLKRDRISKDKTISAWERRGGGIGERKSVPKGMVFFVKKKLEEEIAKEKNRKLKRVLEKILENLGKLACQVNQGKNLNQALTGRKESMVLNANLLIKEEKVEKFQKEVNELKAKYKNLGLIIQESGPWPPFNFVKI